MKSIAKHALLFCLFWAVSAVAVAAKSNGSLAGNVKSISGSPLQNALIKVFRIARQNEIVWVTRSDNRGRFKSTRLVPGTYYLEVSSQGYQPITAAKFTIDPGQTTSLDIILQEFIDLIDNGDDARNWDLKTVMRSTSDRRLIFRDLPGGSAPVSDDEVPSFSRNGAMNIATGTPLGGESYFFHPQTSQNGVSTSFAFAEPLSRHTRMILSGQMDFGTGSFWRLRDTFNYKPDDSHDYRVSVGYGRTNLNHAGAGSFQSQFLTKEPDFKESGMQTLAFGLEGNSKFFDLLALKYGFDYSHIHYGSSNSFVSPYIQILVTPTESWSISTSFTSRRGSESDTVVLADGEMLDLSEPTLITMIGNQASMSQIRHAEIAAQRTVGEKTALEFAVYRDRIDGPGLPLMITTITPLETRSQVAQINEANSSQKGARFTLKRKIIDNLSGSVAYVYGSSAVLYDSGELGSSDCLNGNLTNYMKQRFQHSVTGQLNAIIPLTKTNLLAIMRWYSGNPLVPVDWFSDRMDIGTNSANLEIRQAIPVPDIMGTTGQWDVWMDLRNVLNQGRDVLPVMDGEVILNHNPRSLRFGLSLNFY